MADIYGVLPSDIAAELPALFPVGFTQATAPTLATVTAWISRADARVSVTIQQIAQTSPSDFLVAADLMAKDYIIAFVKARVLQAVYAGNPAALAGILPASYGAAKDTLQSITDLAEVEEETEITKRQQTPPTSTSVATKYTW